MPTYLCQVAFEATSGLAEDQVVNDFVVDYLNPIDETNVGALTLPIASFYNFVAAGGQSVASFISTMVSRATSSASMKVFDITGHLDGSPHGSPVAQDAMTLSPPAVDMSLPEEVAVVLTTRGSGWQGAAVDVPAGAPGPVGNLRPKQRLSGRLYIGPLATHANHGGELAGAEPRPTIELRTALLNAGEHLVDQLAAATPDGSWSVWSRAAAQTTPITHIQVDDAFDTMRSRGRDALGRLTRQVFP